jgi:hypothetical protein
VEGCEWYLAMSAAIECTATFPTKNRIFGVDSLAKPLNALVSDGQISDRHPGRWIDRSHTAIDSLWMRRSQRDFASTEAIIRFTNPSFQRMVLSFFSLMKKEPTDGPTKWTRARNTRISS